MPSMGSVTLLGHAAADCECRFTPNGKEVANFTVFLSPKKGAASFSFKCEAWSPQEWVKGIKKGDLVLVQGRLTPEEWADKKSGETRRGLRVTANEVAVLAAPSGQAAGKPAPAKAPPAVEDDLPF